MKDTADSWVYEFGGFHLDPGRRQLRTPDGQSIPIRAKVFDTLLYLVERAGQLVEKQALIEAVWPSTVVEENNLNQAISTLRRILGDERQTPRFIVTVAGRGYQFVTPVAKVSPGGAQASADPQAPTGARRDPSVAEGATDSARGAVGWRMGLIAGAAVVAVLIGIAIGDRGSAPAPESSALPPVARRALSLRDEQLVSASPGSHTEPRLSPDGTRVVFVGDASGSSQLWVKNVAGGEPSRITDGAPPFGPAWSPKDDQILFYRLGQGLWSVGTFGTPAPRQITQVGRNPSFSWDGEKIVYEIGNQIWLAAADGTNRRRVEGVPARSFTQVWATPSLSPDGTLIAFFLSEEALLGDIWVVPSSGGEPRRITFDRAPAATPIWTPDGERIVYASARNGTQTLWSVGLDGDEPEALTSGVGEDGSPTLSRDGRTLVFSNARTEWSLMRTDPVTGTHTAVHTSRTPIRLPAVSPDGRTIAYFGEHRLGAQIFAATLDEGTITQVTMGAGVLNIMPSWSGDGRSLYFHQMYPSRSLHRIPLAGGPSTEILPDFHFETRTWVAERPQGGVIAYVQWDREVADGSRTILHDLATAEERVLSRPVLRAPSWSRDGQRLLGWQWDPKHGPVLAVCPASGQACDFVMHDGEPVAGRDPKWSHDESTIFFLRPAVPQARLVHELWALDSDGSNERKLVDVGPIATTDVQFGVARDDQIVWARYQRDRSELWMARLGE